MSATEEKVPGQLAQGDKLACYFNGRLYTGKLGTVVRVTKTLAIVEIESVTEPETWQVRVNRLPYTDAHTSQPGTCYYEPARSTRYYYKLLTPALQELLELAGERRKIDGLMEQLQQRTHLLDRAQLQQLQEELTGWLALLPAQPGPEF